MAVAKLPIDYMREAPFEHKWTALRRKCVKEGIPFDLTPDYLESIWTGTCPVFHTRLHKPFHSTNAERNGKHTSSLDRVVPAKGYTKGNVEWVSNYANIIKQKATSEELRKVADHVAMREKEIARYEANRDRPD